MARSEVGQLRAVMVEMSLLLTLFNPAPTVFLTAQHRDPANDEREARRHQFSERSILT